jgi:hypothetical protein
VKCTNYSSSSSNDDSGGGGDINDDYDSNNNKLNYTAAGKCINTPTYKQ